MKKKIYVISTIIFGIVLILSLAACNSPTVKAEELSYVSIKINPEVDFAVSGDTVTAVYAANQDAEILLSDVDLTGMEVSDAVEKFVETATEAGYIDESGVENEVEIGVIGEREEQLRNNLRERIGKYFNNKGIFGRITEETLSLYAEQATDLGISTGKTKMVLKALDINPDLDINELKDMPTNELIALCRDNIKGNGMNATLMNQFKEQRVVILEKYPEILTLKQEIETIKAQLENFEGSEEDRAALENELATKEGECKVLHESYKAEVDVAKEEFKAQKEQIKANFKEQKQQRINEHRARKGKSK